MAAYLKRFDWSRSRSSEPRPPSRTLSIWEEWIDNDPERAWPLFEEFVRQRPEDYDVLEQVWHRLQFLLERHGRRFEGRVRELVLGNANLGRIVPSEKLDASAHRPKPLDIPILVSSYLDNAEYGPDAHELDQLIREDAETALMLAMEIIRRGPQYGFTSYDTFSPLRAVMQLHGSAVIDEVERAASESVLVRRCLWRMARQRSHPPDEHDIALDVWSRAERAIAGTNDYNSGDPPAVVRTLDPWLERIVTAWFAYEDSFWAWEKVGELVKQDPEPAWRIILHLIEGARLDHQLGVIAAGPLEDLLSDHGAHFIDRAEQLAASSDRFRACLGRVWQANMPEALWKRVRAAADEGPS